MSVLLSVVCLRYQLSSSRRTAGWVVWGAEVFWDVSIYLHISTLLTFFLLTVFFTVFCLFFPREA